MNHTSANNSYANTIEQIIDYGKPGDSIQIDSNNMVNVGSPLNETDRMMNSTMPNWHDYAKIALNPKLKKGMNQDTKGN